MKRTWDQMCEMLEEQAKKIERLNKILILQNVVLDKWLTIENEQKEEIEQLKKEKYELIKILCGYGVQNCHDCGDAKCVDNLGEALKDK